ncbi:MAG: hypothetical protein HY362_03080 [Candidatus Aenigmarchaeota archaeon]|nr:hypothetical protein [Candidatus Aenigmarchaeota archaeon]
MTAVNWKEELGIRGNIQIRRKPANPLGVSETHTRYEQGYWVIYTNNPTSANISHEYLHINMAENGFPWFVPCTFKNPSGLTDNVKDSFQKALVQLNTGIQDNISHAYLWRMHPRISGGVELREQDLLDIYNAAQLQLTAFNRSSDAHYRMVCEKEDVKAVSDLFGTEVIDLSVAEELMKLGVLEAAFDRWLPDKSRLCAELLETVPERWKKMGDKGYKGARKICEPFFDKDPDNYNIGEIETAMSAQLELLGFAPPEFYPIENVPDRTAIIWVSDPYSKALVRNHPDRLNVVNRAIVNE